MEFATRYIFYNGYKQYTSNNKCQTTLHKIPISTVTISFTKLSQGIPRGGSIHDSPCPGIQFGDPTKLSPVGFLYNQFILSYILQ